MIEVIPTIIAKNFQELQEKIKKIEPYTKWVQLDIMDGRFVDNITWRNPKELKNLETNLFLEAHLMIFEPEHVIEDWIESGVKRIIFHYESTHKRKEIIEKIKNAGLEIGIALDVITPIEFIDILMPDLDLVLIMTVRPGWGGQKFMEETLLKIKNLRSKYPNVNIGVDGGINSETGRKAIEAGANILASGSYIFGSEDIKKAIDSLKNL